jgi:hypothetical protein
VAYGRRRAEYRLTSLPRVGGGGRLSETLRADAALARPTHRDVSRVRPLTRRNDAAVRRSHAAR